MLCAAVELYTIHNEGGTNQLIDPRFQNFQVGVRNSAVFYPMEWMSIGRVIQNSSLDGSRGVIII